MPAPIAVEKRRVVVEAYLNRERPAHELARELGVSVPSIHRWVRQVRRGSGLEPRPHAGGPKPLLAPEELKVLVELATTDPHATRAQLRESLRHKTGMTLSSDTVGRYLHQAGVYRRRPVATRPPETTAPSIKRYGFTEAHRPARARYPSDLTDAQWALLEPWLSGRGGAPRKYPAREVLNAIFYVVRTGCSWRMLPHDFPPWDDVYATFHRWVENGQFERLHGVLRTAFRQSVGRNANPSAAILDSQSVKTAEKGGPKDTMVARR